MFPHFHFLSIDIIIYRLGISGATCSTSSLLYHHTKIGVGSLKKGANHALGGLPNPCFPEKPTESSTIVVVSLGNASCPASAARRTKSAPHAVGVEDCASIPDP